MAEAVFGPFRVVIFLFVLFFSFSFGYQILELLGINLDGIDSRTVDQIVHLLSFGWLCHFVCSWICWEVSA